MAIKTTIKLDDLNLNEPLYDREKMEAYCQEKQISIEELSEEEKKRFIIGMMSFSLPMNE